MSPWPWSLRATPPDAPALSAGSEGLDPASDALCRAGPLREVNPASNRYQGWLKPPSRQRRRSSPIQSAFHRRRSPLSHACARWSGAAPPTSAIPTIQEHNPGSIRTPMDAPRGRPRDVLRWRWSSTGRYPDGASPAGHRRVAWRLVLRRRRGLHPDAAPLDQARPVQDHSIRTRSAFAAQEPLVWMRHDESRRIAEREALPRSEWLAHLLS
jgi:hypothetical protein